MHNSGRYTLIDALRGFALVNMILYHALWDINYIFDAKIAWYTSHIGYVWQQMICCTFIFVSGFCFPLGKHRLKRGLITLGCSAIISIITAVFMPKNIILFGILSLIGSSVLLMIPLSKLFDKINPYIGLIIFLSIFIMTKTLKYPIWQHGNLFTAYFGFRPVGFVSTDYFPLVPWLFLYIVGYFMQRIFDKHNLMLYLSDFKNRPLEWIGRHSLAIYMAHQPVIYALLYIIY